MKKRDFIFILLYISYTAIYVARLNLSMASPEFIELDILDTAQIGILGSIFSVIYALGRLINGSLGDKTPPWIMISSGLLICGIANISIGFLPPFAGIVLLWGTNAYAQSMLWSSILTTISQIYDKEKAKKMVSYVVTTVAMGNIIGILLNTWIIKKLGVNFAFLIPGGITLILSLPVMLLIKDVNPVTLPQKEHISIFGLFKNREILKILLPVMFHGAIKDNISLWMTVYFTDFFKIDLASTAGFVLFIPLVGFVARCIYPALLSLCRQKEHIVSLTSFILCTAVTIPLCFNISSAVIAVICLSVIYALISIINTSMLSIYPMRFAKTGNISSVSGLMDFATYGGAGISSWIYGMIIKEFGYSPMFISWVIITLISVIILTGIIKKDCHNIENKTITC